MMAPTWTINSHFPWISTVQAPWKFVNRGNTKTEICDFLIARRRVYQFQNKWTENESQNQRKGKKKTEKKTPPWKNQKEKKRRRNKPRQSTPSGVLWRDFLMFHDIPTQAERTDLLFSLHFSKYFDKFWSFSSYLM